MRWIAALAAIGFIVVVCLALPAGAADPVDCQTKETHVALVLQKHPKAIVTDLSGPVEVIFLANLSRLVGRDLSGLDAHISRHPGFRVALVALFGRGGCMVVLDQLPNEMVSALLGGKEGDA